LNSYLFSSPQKFRFHDFFLPDNLEELHCAKFSFNDLLSYRRSNSNLGPVNRTIKRIVVDMIRVDESADEYADWLKREFAVLESLTIKKPRIVINFLKNQ